MSNNRCFKKCLTLFVMVLFVTTQMMQTYAAEAAGVDESTYPVPTYCSSYPDVSKKYQYNVLMQWTDKVVKNCDGCGKDKTDNRFTEYYEYCISADTEVVGVLKQGKDTNDFYLVTTANDTASCTMRQVSLHLECGHLDKYDEKTVGLNDSSFEYDESKYYYCYRNPNILYAVYFEKNFAINTDIIIFNTLDSACKYLKTGFKENIYADVTKDYDGQGIYLDDFQMIVYDSNEFDNYYLQFKYSIPDNLKNSDLTLIIDSYYTYQLTGLSGLIPEDWSYYGNPDLIIDLNEYPTGFILYLSDIKAINQFINDENYQCGKNTTKRRLLGSLGAINILCNWGESLACIDKSYLELSCVVTSDGVYGIEYNGEVDFLSGANCMSSYTPDETGNYTYNDDYAANGRYYTEVGIDSAGNPTYNYYYYDVRGTRTETDSAGSNIDVSSGDVTQINNNNVNIPDTINVTVNGGLSGGSSSTPNFDNVTIEDDDLSFKSLADVMKSGFGIIDDVDTDVKGDGFPSMLAYLYQGLPDVFNKIIMLGVSSVTGIAILLRLFNR